MLYGILILKTVSKIASLNMLVYVTNVCDFPIKYAVQKW